MHENVGLRNEEIELFTGHEKEDNILAISYLDSNTIEKKPKLIERLKVGKGI
jgi:hypothetical protein